MSVGPQPRKWSLTSAKMIQARKEYIAGSTIRKLADQYHVSYGTMQSVISGRHPSVRLSGGQKLSRTRGGKRHHG